MEAALWSAVIQVVFTAKPIWVDLKADPRYLEKYENSSINYTACSNVNFFDYEEVDEEECHVNQLNESIPIEDKFGVRSCCHHPGFVESAICEGIDRHGRKAEFSNVGICVRHKEVLNNRTVAYERVRIDCPPGCTLETGVLEEDEIDLEEAEEGAGKILVVGEEKFDNFCLGRHCEDDSWLVSYSACGTCVTAKENNSELQAQFKNRSLPLCCGLSGTLMTDTDTCDNGAVLPGNLSTCNWTNKQTIVIIEDPDPEELPEDAVCVSRVGNNRKLYRGAMRCQQDCQGDSCFTVCHLENQAYNPKARELVTNLTEARTTFQPTVGLNASTNYGYPKKSPITTCNLASEIFPEDSCKDSVQFQANGSVTFMETGHVLDYGQFCISHLAGDTSRGSYMIRTCKEKEKEKKQAKFDFYYIVLCISIACLVATILVYAIFHTALLNSEYNKLMINFAISLLFAFLFLVILQVPRLLPDKQKTKTVCTGIALSNQFFIISTFTWMTLMSYNIFNKIHGMKVMRIGQRPGFLWKKALIGYGIPALISLTTFIVEMTAPRCASIRPKFGHKSCLFYGKLDKFVWLYLPILILLIINTFMFIYITINVLMNRKNESRQASKQGGRMEKFDHICLYLRLFLGMGIIWYFEILTFVVDDAASEAAFYFTDVLNMLQGVWVFLTFVCKRNVIKVVTRKTDHLYSAVRTMTVSTRQDTVSHKILERKTSVTVTSMMSQSETGV